MPKTNFTKVEEILDEGLRKYTAEQLLEIADKAGTKRARNPAIAYSEETGKSEALQLTKEQSHLISALQRDLKRLQKRDKKLYGKLGMAKKELMALMASSGTLKPEDWEKLKGIEAKIEQMKAEFAKLPPEVPNDALIETERRAHITRRYNVNKKWLPLQ